MTRRYFQGFTYDQVTTGWSFDSTNDWSVCAWVYIASNGSGGGDVFFQDDGTYIPTNMAYLGYERNAANTGPALRFVCGDGSVRVMDRSQDCNTGQWYHMALVHDASAGTVTAYVDAVQVEQATSVTLTTTFTRTEYGDFGGGNDVEVAQAKAWNGYALSAADIADEMAYWTPQHGTGFVVAWWQFDDASQLTDSSGNGHTIGNVASGGGSPGPGLQTVPGQLNPSPTVLPVAASGGAVGGGTAAVSYKARVQATGNAVASGTAWVSTNVAPAGGSASSFGGRSRKRRNRR